MSKVVEKLASAGHLTDAQVERIGEAVQDFIKVAQDDPEFMQETLEKLGLWDAMKGAWEGLHPLTRAIAGTFATGAAGTAGVLAAHKLMMKGEDVSNELKKAKNYKAMLDANPDLQDAKVDASQVQKHYDTLHKFNPEYASDPVVAGTYVSNALDMERPSLDTINNLVKARREIAQSRSGGGEALARTMVEFPKAVSQATRDVRHTMDDFDRRFNQPGE